MTCRGTREFKIINIIYSENKIRILISKNINIVFLSIYNVQNPKKRVKLFVKNT